MDICSLLAVFVCPFAQFSLVFTELWKPLPKLSWYFFIFHGNIIQEKRYHEHLFAKHCAKKLGNDIVCHGFAGTVISFYFCVQVQLQFLGLLAVNPVAQFSLVISAFAALWKGWPSLVSMILA